MSTRVVAERSLNVTPALGCRAAAAPGPSAATASVATPAAAAHSPLRPRLPTVPDDARYEDDPGDCARGRRRGRSRHGLRRGVGTSAAHDGGLLRHPRGYAPHPRRAAVPVRRGEHRVARRRRLRACRPARAALSEPLRDRRRDGDRAPVGRDRRSKPDDGRLGRLRCMHRARRSASFNDAAFERVDYALASARAHGIKIIATIVGDDALEGGSGCVYLRWRGISQPNCSLHRHGAVLDRPGGDRRRRGAHRRAARTTSTSTRTWRTRTIRRFSAGIC